MHWECKFCNRPAGYMGIPIAVEGELVCSCGAEWEEAKIMAENDIAPDDPWINDYKYEDDIFDEDLDEDNYDELEAVERKAAEEW